ncbi:hypothetical protein ZWY2020_011658 [Hordeum vulgare]|nr:hypothetical protein ZWY2020_011658 [Hordeum vulgare]
MSKLKSELDPFCHEYPDEKESELNMEQERDKRIKFWHEYQKLDNKDKARKEMEFDMIMCRVAGGVNGSTSNWKPQCLLKIAIASLFQQTCILRLSPPEEMP